MNSELERPIQQEVVGQMIDDLERDDKRLDYEKKTQEVIDNLENEEVTRFLKTHAAIEHSATTSNLSDKLYELAIQRLQENSFELFERMSIELDKAHRVQREYLRHAGKSVYEQFIDGEIVLPTLSQFEKCIEADFDNFMIIPQEIDIDYILLRFGDGLKAISGKFSMPLYIEASSLPGSASHGVIALQRDTESASKGVGAKSGASNPRDKRYFDWRKEVDGHVVLNQDETMHLQGLSFKEYIMMQFIYLNEQLEINKGLTYPLSGIELLDREHDSAAILTGSWREDLNGSFYDFITARWNMVERELRINGPSDNTDYFPWYAIHFDKIKDNANESGAK